MGRLLTIIALLAIVSFAAGFGYVAFTDMTVEQRTVNKTIPNEQFLGE